MSVSVENMVIWNTTDPYVSSNSTSDVLYTLTNYWSTNNNSINRDLVHFITKRNLGGGVMLGWTVYVVIITDMEFL